MIVVRFMAATGKFREIARESFATVADAIRACEARYAPLGFTKFREHDEVDFDGGRITATTPGGRGGLNVAFYDGESP